MMRVAAEGLRNGPFKFSLNGIRRLARRKAGSVADPEDMGVDRKSLLAKSRVEDDVCCLPSNSRQGLQLVASLRNLASILINQLSAEGDNILRLGVEKTNCLDRRAEPVLAQSNHLRWRADVLE